MCTCKAPFMHTHPSSTIYTDTWSNLRKRVASLRMQTRANVCKLALRKPYIDCFNSFFTYILIRLSFQCSIFILLQALPLSRVGQALTMLLYGTRSWLRRSRSTYVLRVLSPSSACYRRSLVGKNNFASHTEQAMEIKGSTSFMWDNMEYLNFRNKE